MYMINVALFAEMNCQSLALYFFLFLMQPWERSHWILEREWQRESWENQKPCTSLRSDWAQLFKTQGLQLYRIDLEEMQIPYGLNSDLDLKCYSRGHQLIYQPNSLHY